MAKLKTQNDGMSKPFILILFIIIIVLYIASYGPFVALMQNERGNVEFITFMDSYIYKPHVMVVESSPAYNEYIQWWTKIGESF